jgi:YihY family inner membrane protein
MSTATRVPETYDRTGDNPLETLRGLGWARLARDAFERFRAADGFSHSRALAYQITLLAIPGLIASVGLAALLNQQGLRNILRNVLTGLAPGPSSQIFTQALRQGSHSGRNAFVIGLAAALVTGTFAMAQVERGCNRIYGMDSDRSTLDKYKTGFILAISAGLLNIAAFVVLVAGPAIADAAVSGGWSDSLVTVWQVVRWPLGVALAVAGFALLFNKSPRRRQPPASWLAIGSAVSVALWFIFTGLLSWYLSSSGSFGETYGPLAGMVGVLLWAFLTSIALFLGVAFAAQLEAARAGVTTPAAESDAGPKSEVDVREVTSRAAR